MSSTAATCDNCDESIHLASGDLWVHDSTNAAPCPVADIPVAEPASVECESERHSWEFLNSDHYDSYWMRCDLTYPHDEHENQETGIKWTDIVKRERQDTSNA